ncbi:TetR/AcrR family transcriptional regulator [Curtobacterium oceanosedimentum]|uniref:TetR/AcrR family transcriptional regulator n=1 Tax=Curtobacterium oceanosedimentum TaxID=465820 RepID=UPI001CE08427|nr:TetR/AcrR family transcriptional regulator [Curtobacterium oceanosedimentum]MCA5924281.1 WHG domain-containing protein [Curtobacterium oceanosedimentum]
MPRAGLDPAAVTEAAATLADEIGLAQLSMSVVAGRLGVKAPSLYKHVDGLADLTHRIAVLGATELGDALREAMQGRAGRDALDAALRTLRRFVRERPARYAAAVGVRPDGPDDPLSVALDRALSSFGAALHGYPLAPDDRVHALRVLRSVVHGFATTEAAGGFRMGTDVKASAAWLVEFLDRGFRTTARD